jgi:hypothetical protein
MLKLVGYVIFIAVIVAVVTGVIFSISNNSESLHACKDRGGAPIHDSKGLFIMCVDPKILK